jgi:hypothetical protein
MRPDIDDCVPPIGRGSETITILRSRARRLAKLICADGSIKDYSSTRAFDLAEIAIADLNALEELLGRLERRRDCCIVRGAIADHTRTKGVRRLLYPDRQTGDAPALREVPRQWLALDFDRLDKPGWIDHADLLGCACVAIRTLPNEFQEARFIVQATGSHGLKPGIRLRLWCWLARPVTGAELKYWLRRSQVDPSIFGPASIVYTAAPQIQPGAFDPLKTRIAVVPGTKEIVVPGADRLRPLPRRKLEFKSDQQGDISRLVRAVAGAAEGSRNAMLYWAACRLAETAGGDHARGGDLLEAAAIQAGLSAVEAAATIRSALRHGGE